MEKYGNKSPFMKIVHKYTGFIVFGAILAILTVAYVVLTDSQEFFEKWSCSQIEYYLIYENTQNSEMPDHDSLSEKQHQRLHEIIAECNIEHKFD